MHTIPGLNFGLCSDASAHRRKHKHKNDKAEGDDIPTEEAKKNEALAAVSLFFLSSPLLLPLLSSPLHA